MRTISPFLAAALVLTWPAAAVHATSIFTVTVNTGGLSHDPSLSGPFAVDFQLNQGNAAVNYATISNIMLNGGSAVGSPTYTGNASGNLNSSIKLNDNGSFANEFSQQLTPGSKLSFVVTLTTNTDPITPDQFTFSLLQKYGTSNVMNVPTIDPTGANTLLTVTIDSNSPSFATYAGTNGDPSAPTVQFGASPEPSTLVLSSLALFGVALARGWQHCRRICGRLSMLHHGR
jgi:hypothetical protein